MNQGSLKNTRPDPKKLTNFIESLKSRQGSGMPNAFGEANRPPAYQEFLKEKKLKEQRVEQFHQARQREWEQVFSAKKIQREKRIEEIRAELEKLAKEVAKLNANIAQAVASPTPKPGIYHKTFLEHIREVIALLKKQTKEANSWLQVYQARAKKKGRYWTQAKKGGAAYMFSEERQLATSVG